MTETKYQITTQVRGTDKKVNVNADSSWTIKVTLKGDDLQLGENQQKTQYVRVRGNTEINHVGGLIQKLVTNIEQNAEKSKENWTEYELWWPSQRKWLLKHHWMLEKYNIQVNPYHFERTLISVQADTELEFTKRNKSLYVELPNQKIIKVKANFSIDVLSVVRDICYLCEIRFHTEMSLMITGRQVCFNLFFNYSNLSRYVMELLKVLNHQLLSSRTLKKRTVLCALRHVMDPKTRSFRVVPCLSTRPMKTIKSFPRRARSWMSKLCRLRRKISTNERSTRVAFWIL